MNIEGNFEIPAVKNNQLITIITEFSSTPNPNLVLSHNKMPEGKTTGFIPYTDDAGPADYTHLHKYLQGVETADGNTYPLWTYSDGCGNQRPAKFSIGLNANPDHDEDSGNPNAAKWSQLIPMFSKETTGNPIVIGHRLCYPTNHGYNHAGADKYNEITLNTKKFWEKFGLLCTTGVVPGADAGYAASGPLNYVPIWMSTWGVAGMDDGYGYSARWFPTLMNASRHLYYRYYAGNTINQAAIDDFETQVNAHYAACTGVGDAVGYFCYFYHGIIDGGLLTNFHAMCNIIKDHANYENAGIYTAQEALDYELVRRGVYIQNKIVGNKLYTYLSYSGIERHLVYFNASFTVENANASIVSVTVESNVPDAEVKFNSETGLINMYAENPFVINPNTDPVLPEITAITAVGTIVTITYSMSVTQTLSAGYTIVDYTDPENLVDNPVLSLTGSGTSWELECTNTVTASSKFFYKLQNGDAASTANPDLLLCSYIGSDID